MHGWEENDEGFDFFERLNILKKVKHDFVIKCILNLVIEVQSWMLSFSPHFAWLYSLEGR